MNGRVHKQMLCLLILFFWLPAFLCARIIDTFYGPMDVQEEVLIELIDSPIFQRLKEIHQYGVAYYTTHHEEYNRFDHSIGVFAILRANNASLEEQIAGLLHDVSHTAFSHVGDWIFQRENRDKSYQDEIHAQFLEKSSLKTILEKHHFTIEEVMPKAERFLALDCPLPDLCADRIDYNIQGAYYQGFITYDEAKAIFNDLRFIDNKWVSRLPELMKKISKFSLFMTLDCWGSPTNHVTSRWLADAILRSIEIGTITLEEIHFGTDQAIWDKLVLQYDPIVMEKMALIRDFDTYISVVDFSEEFDLIVKSKFRGVNPWVIVRDSECVRITSIDSELAKEYEAVREKVSNGWPVKILTLKEAAFKL